jgi:adenylosuccinate synthase
MSIYAVIGLGFGDECKGSFTQHLCILNNHQNKKNLVIRFNGGHQAGHTVVYNKTKHIFSSFGSGTLIGETTFWSRFCTVFPPALFNEYHVLKENGITPKIIFDPLCPVTTPYDVISNKESDKKNNHGTVGVGFGATIKRQEDNYKLHYQDLFNPTIREAKMECIKNYYEKIHGEINIDDQIDIWYKCIDALIEEKVMTKEKLELYTVLGLPTYENIIFEGAQGILLDMDYGFFPNVTRSNTTTKNINTLMTELGAGYRFGEELKIFYITRAYQTRHGNGFMTNENHPPTLINNKNEINLDTSKQGKFRKGLLDLDLIKYALDSDNNFSSKCKKSIVVTCVDQLPDGIIEYTKNKKIIKNTIQEFKETLKREFNHTVYLGKQEGVFEYEGEPIPSYTGYTGYQGYQAPAYNLYLPFDYDAPAEVVAEQRQEAIVDINLGVSGQRETRVNSFSKYFKSKTTLLNNSTKSNNKKMFKSGKKM